MHKHFRCEPYLVTPACSAVIDWDTAYGYHNEKEGFGCSELHARAIEYLSRNLPQGITFKWQNEFTGEIFNGLDGLDEFRN